ncbi:MAG: AAA family ATPase [Desulfomicrobium escambiense]|nr:AAA family ATPase [Desulfomicrobium escambiense]
MRDGLRNLYSVIKDSDAHLRFAFLTGVSKFSKVSLFSGLNNLQRHHAVRATTRRSAATPRPMSTPYSPRNWTDSTASGFAAGTTATTGPARRSTTPSMCCCCSRNASSGPGGSRPARRPFSSTCSTRAPASSPPNLARLADRPGTAVAPSTWTRSPREALLFQTGYLTIDQVEETAAAATGSTRLRYPNHEVVPSLNAGLLTARTPTAQATLATPQAPARAAAGQRLCRDWNGLFHAFFASIPARLVPQQPDRPLRRLLRQRVLQPISPPWGWTSPWKTPAIRAGST